MSENANARVLRSEARRVDTSAIFRYSATVDEPILDIALKCMELREDGDLMTKRSRLFQFLYGEYKPSEFIENPVIPDPRELSLHREALRELYLEIVRRAIMGASGTMRHEVSMESTTPLGHSSITNCVENQVNFFAMSTNRDQEGTGGIDHESQRGEGGGTRYSGSRDNGVNNPTFDPLDLLNAAPQSTQVAWRRMNENNAEVRDRPGRSATGGGGTVPEWTRSSTQSSMLPGQRGYVGATVRKWNLRFSGDPGSIMIDDFLERIEEFRQIDGLTEDEVFGVLFGLVEGTALEWVRQRRHRWYTWKDFREAALSAYGVGHDLQMQLRREAERRTQGDGESVHVYVVCIQSILKKLERPLGPDLELELIFNNLHPRIKLYLRRVEIRNVDDLLAQARAVEGVIKSSNVYAPPPAPEDTLVPQAACKAAKSTQRSQLSISAINRPSEDDLRQIVVQTMDERYREFEKNHENNATTIKVGAAGSQQESERDAREN